MSKANDENGNKKTRKISCMPCRIKKTKCDAQLPYCTRCIRNSRENNCVYPKPRTFGRPPKNSVFQRNQDNLTVTAMTCREFIFEQIPPDSKTLARKDPLIIDIEKIYRIFIEKGDFLRNKICHHNPRLKLKIKNLRQHNSLIVSNVIHLTIKRSCQLLEFKSYFDPELAISAFTKEPDADQFFFTNHVHNNTTPLNSIPTDQAMKLIHFFFQSNPHCILINKTRLLERYWKDSAEPLLLSVIYGTTISVGQHILEGKPFTLHQCTAKRNPFLDYAYILYEQVYASRQISLGNYQAIVLLSLYEISLGYSKHGMTMLSLSYMIAAELGVFDDQGMCASMDLIDREQLVTTYWTALSATSHGCLELGFHVRERLLFHKQPFPPATASTSASYQYDLINNNHGPTTRAYFIESFHVGMVINYFSSKIAICLPTTKDNVFGLSVTKSDRNLALSLFHHDDEGTIKYKIQLVLNDFSIFIEQEKHQWTPRQLFMIETTHQLYRIHFNFIKSKNTGLQLETVKELDLNDQNIVRLLQCALPISYTLTHNLDQFIQQSCQMESEEMLDMLPIGLMAITLETVAQIFIYNYLLSNEQEKVLDHLNRAYCISKKSIWRHWTPMRSIQKMLKDFLKNKPSDIFQKHFTVHEPTDDITCFLFTDDERESPPEIEATFLNDINSYFQNMFASENTSLYF